jgi:hypothetical protein
MNISNAGVLHTYHSGVNAHTEPLAPSSSSARLNSAQDTQPQSAENTQQDALVKLNQLLTPRAEKASLPAQQAVAQYAANEPMTAEKVANNIIGAIARQLQQYTAEGASPAQRQSRLDAGIAGFNKGFSEAAEQLKALNVNSPSLDSDLSKTHDLVISGLAALQNTIQPSENTLRMRDIPMGVAVAAQHTQAIKLQQKGQAEAREFSFELTTKEGDKVSIHAQSSYAVSTENSRDGAAFSYSDSNAFSFSVEGNLNDDETKAINDLLSKVNDLTDQFYNGNLDEAFQQAQTLDYSEQQISGFSLHLAQAKIQESEVISQGDTANFDEIDDSTPKDLSVNLHPLSKYIRTLLEALDTANLFHHPEKLLLDASQGINSQDLKQLDTQDNKNSAKHPSEFLAEIMTGLNNDSLKNYASELQ